MPTNPKKPSLRSVSRIAGVSPATVSRVLNNSAILPEATRKCVMDAVRESGYQTNPQLSRVMRQNRSGRREVRGVTDTIGYLTPLRLLDSGYSGDGYYSEAIRGVREELAKHQKHLMWEAAESGQASLPQMILDGRVDGVLVEATIPQETLEVLARQAPAVLMDRSCADVHGVKADEVLADFEAAMLSSLGHLWSLGHRNMVTFQHAIQTYDQRQSLDGFGRFFREVGASPVHPDLCQPCPIDPRNNARVIADYVQRLVHARPMPTAIVVGSGYAADVMFALKHVGVRIPDQMSVAGLNQTPYEDQDKLASVTSYSMPMRMIGVEAVRLLLDRIAHPDGPRRSLRIEGHFVDHGSMSRVSSDGLPG